MDLVQRMYVDRTSGFVSMKYRAFATSQHVVLCCQCGILLPWWCFAASVVFCCQCALLSLFMHPQGERMVPEYTMFGRTFTRARKSYSTCVPFLKLATLLCALDLRILTPASGMPSTKFKGFFSLQTTNRPRRAWRGACSLDLVLTVLHVCHVCSFLKRGSINWLLLGTVNSTLHSRANTIGSSYVCLFSVAFILQTFCQERQVLFAARGASVQIYVTISIATTRWLGSELRYAQQPSQREVRTSLLPCLILEKFWTIPAGSN